MRRGRLQDFGISAGGAARAAFCGFSLRGFVRRRSPPQTGISRNPEQTRHSRAPTIRGEKPKSRNPETPEERRGGVSTPPRRGMAIAALALSSENGFVEEKREDADTFDAASFKVWETIP